MLSDYTENELIAHINQMRAVRWLAAHEEKLAMICGFQTADVATYEQLMSELREAGLGELGLVVACQLTHLLEGGEMSGEPHL